MELKFQLEIYHELQAVSHFKNNQKRFQTFNEFFSRNIDDVSLVPPGRLT